MYAGRVVESAPVREVFAAPAHPYTAALLASIPRLDTPLTECLASLDGQPPHPGDQHAGCAFAPRCPAASDPCRAVRPQLRSAGEREVACHAPLVGAGATP